MVVDFGWQRGNPYALAVTMESVVLLDEAGRARGAEAKAVVHHAQTPLHLAFSCYLFNGTASSC
jgi:isopentenyl-diphosphate delta-isomerase